MPGTKNWKGKQAPELVDGEWVSSKPLTLSALRGKVVLVDFWEYSCINCIRTLPYLREWYKRYRQYGLEIIGVHVPEFEFGKERANVEAAMRQYDITWTVVLDNDYKTWNAYNNNVWPRELLINQQGTVVHDQAGEGGYRETEQLIQQLLKKDHPDAQFPEPLEYVRETDQPGRACFRTSPELYLGSQRGKLGNVEQPSKDQPTTFSDPGELEEDVMYVGGTWRQHPEFLQPVLGQMGTTTEGGSAKKRNWVGLKYHAKGVYFVIKPQTEAGFRVWVEQDGKPVVKKAAGEDLAINGHGSYLTVDSARMYRVIDNPQFGVHTLKFYPESDSFAGYAFTFESACQK